MDSDERPIRDANGVVSMAVGGSPGLFIIRVTVNKFGGSERVHPGREEHFSDRSLQTAVGGEISRR